LVNKLQYASKMKTQHHVFALDCTVWEQGLLRWVGFGKIPLFSNILCL